MNYKGQMFDWYRRAHTAIAQGALTNSKRVETFIKGVTPTHCVPKAQGPYIWGVDGKRYLDYCCANGTNLFGYEHPLIRQAIASSPYGVRSLGTTLEVECAELVKDRVPFVKKVRFLKEGTSACAAALRIARAHTGRSKVLSSGYHGWSDDFVYLSPPALGVPERGHIESLRDFSDIRSDVAAVIVEPIVTDYSTQRKEWLTELIRKCRVNGTIVIFDEIITGFRWPRLSFSADSGIHPDIILLGKACASGLPLSIVGLAEHIGDNSEWFISGTYHGEMQSLSVMKRTCEMLHNKFKLEELWKDGGYFIEEFNQIWPEGLKLEGYPTRGVFVGDALVKALFLQESHKALILFGPSWFYGFQHMGLREQTISTCKDILNRIKNKQVTLDGEMPSSPFAQKVRAA